MRAKLNSRRLARAGSALFAACVAVACADDERHGVDKPVAPQMRTLAAYDAPTAAISTEQVDDLLRQVSTFVSAVDQLAIERTLLQSLRAGLAQVDRSDTARTVDAQALRAQPQALSLPGSGYLEITRICDGWGVAPVADLANGTLELLAGFEGERIDPVIWGTVTACRYRLGEHQVELDGTALDPADGDVRMYIGPNVTEANLDSFPDPVVVELTAQATIDGRELASELNFRIDLTTRALELLVPLGSGHALVEVDPARDGDIEARGSNGTFSCEMDALRCTGADGEELSVR